MGGSLSGSGVFLAGVFLACSFGFIEGTLLGGERGRENELGCWRCRGVWFEQLGGNEYREEVGLVVSMGKLLENGFGVCWLWRALNTSRPWRFDQTLMGSAM